MKSLSSIVTMAVIAIFCLVVGFTSLIDGIAATNADDLNFNTMAQSDMEEYSYVVGKIEFVYGCFAEGYTERSTYGITTSTTTDSYYYLVECPYSPEDTMMILEIPVNTTLETSIDELWEQGYYATSEYQLAEYAVTFSAYLERNDDEIVKYAKEALEESGDLELKSMTIAPYTLNCTIKSGFETRSLGIGIVCLVIALVLAIVIILKIRSIHRAPSYSTPYNTNGLGTQVSSSVGSMPTPRVEDYYGGTYSSSSNNAYGNNTTDTYQSQYRSQTSQSGQAYQPQFQTQQTQSGQTFQTQQTQGNQTYQSQYRSQQTQGSQNYQSQYRQQQTQGGQPYQSQYHSQQTQGNQSYPSQYNNNGYGAGYYGNSNNSANPTSAIDTDDSYFQHR